MKQFTEQEYTINICVDIIEWGKEFYGMPDDAVLANKEELESECMGFSSIDNKEVWIFVPTTFDEEDLAQTLAHEIGHIIVPRFTINPKQIRKNSKLHEKKAEYYTNYYITVRKILKEIVNIIQSINNGK